MAATNEDVRQLEAAAALEFYTAFGGNRCSPVKLYAVATSLIIITSNQPVNSPVKLYAAATSLITVAIKLYAVATSLITVTSNQPVNSPVKLYAAATSLITVASN
ncbi:hypothetical protein MY10362_005806 [Beauveria mimosiformis]